MASRLLWAGIGAALAIAGVVVSYRETSRRFAPASPSEILALIPAEFREAPPSDPVVAARRKKLIESANSAKGFDLHAIPIVLDLKPLPVPLPPPPELEEYNARFRTFTTFQDRLRTRVKGFVRTKNRAACGETLIAAFQLVRAYDRILMSLQEEATFGEFVSTLADLTEEADHEGALTAADRERLLTLIPPESIWRDSIARTIASHFREDVLPLLLQMNEDPEALKRVWELPEIPDLAGSFDSLETTRLLVSFARAKQSSIHSGKKDPEIERRRRALQSGLPVPPSPARANLWSNYVHRWSVNHRPNTLGRDWAAAEFGFDLSDSRADYWRRIRTALANHL